MLLTVLEIFLCCGTIFGWPNLLKILKEEEFYMTKAGNISVAVTGVPEEPKVDEKSPQQIQDEAFTAIFTLATTLFAVAAFCAGILMDSVGSLKTRLVGLILFIAGAILVTIAKPGETDNFLKYGWTSICCAGIFLLVTQFQVANFYEAARGRVLCVFNGAMDSSSCSALLFLTIYNALGYSMTWTIYASLSALIIYRTFFLLPADAIPYPLPSDYKTIPAYKSLGSSKPEEAGKSVELLDEEKNNNYEDKEENRVEEKEVPAFFSTSVAFSPLFISTALFFIIQVTRVYFYLGGIQGGTQELVKVDQNCTQAEAGDITGTMMTNFAIFQFGGVGYAFLNGMVIDKTLAATGDKNKALAAGVFLTTTLGISFTGLTLIANTTLQYASFFLSVLHRSFTFGINATVIGLSFPNEHFGKLYGTTQIFTIISAQATDMLFKYAAENSFVAANRILLYLEIISLFHFCILLYLIRKS